MTHGFAFNMGGCNIFEGYTTISKINDHNAVMVPINLDDGDQTLTLKQFECPTSIVKYNSHPDPPRSDHCGECHQKVIEIFKSQQGFCLPPSPSSPMFSEMGDEKPGSCHCGPLSSPAKHSCTKCYGYSAVVCSTTTNCGPCGSYSCIKWNCTSHCHHHHHHHAHGHCRCS